MWSSPLLRLTLSTCVLAAGATRAQITVLTPDNWELTRAEKGGGRWLIFFHVVGCKHCAQMLPMVEAIADQLAADKSTACVGGDGCVRIGKVDASAHGGIARTFGVKKFPW